MSVPESIDTTVETPIKEEVLFTPSLDIAILDRKKPIKEQTIP